MDTENERADKGSVNIYLDVFTSPSEASKQKLCADGEKYYLVGCAALKGNQCLVDL